jgi:hypothetical protein
VNFDLPNAVAVLERTPNVLRSLLADLPDEWTRPNEGPDTWSPFDVVGHLISAEEVDWLERARIILAQGPDRKFVPFDRYRNLEANRGKTLGELLDWFADLRSRNLRELASLGIGSRELELTGEHPEFGTVTLSQLLSTWVAHDLGHIAQISRVMAKQYREAVGPWTAYLPVLTR